MKTHIQIQLVKVVKMSRAGEQRWRPSLRYKVSKWCFKAQRSETVALRDINTTKKLADHVWRYYGPGRWQVRAPCPNKKARFGSSMKTLVELELSPDPSNEWRYFLMSWKEKRLGHYKKMLNWEEQHR